MKLYQKIESDTEDRKIKTKTENQEGRKSVRKRTRKSRSKHKSKAKDHNQTKLEIFKVLKVDKEQRREESKIQKEQRIMCTQDNSKQKVTIEIQEMKQDSKPSKVLIKKDLNAIVGTTDCLDEMVKEKAKEGIFCASEKIDKRPLKRSEKDKNKRLRAYTPNSRGYKLQNKIQKISS